MRLRLGLATPLLLASLAWGGCGDELKRQKVAQAEQTWQSKLEQGQLAQALTAATELQAAVPDRPEGFLMAARIYDARMDPDQVVANLLQAYALKPQDFPQLPELIYAMGLTSNISHSRMHEFVELHATRYPNDPNLWEARVTALSATIHDKDTTAEMHERLLAELKKLFSGYQLPVGANTKTYYNLSDALLLQDRLPEAMGAMAAGMKADTDTWDRLTLALGLACLQLHQGDEEQARQGFHDYLDSYEKWQGYHFGMLMPVAEYVRLTLKVRFDEDLELSSTLESRRQRTLQREVSSPLGEEAIALSLRDLLATAALGKTQSMARHLADLQTIFGRDRGCIMESQVLKPHVLSMARVLYADHLANAGEVETAAAQYAAALEAWPEDAWLQQRAATAAPVAPQ